MTTTATTTEKKETGIQKQVATPSERFTAMVQKEFTGTGGDLQLAPYHKRLIGNYFIGVDVALKTAEEKRLKKQESYRDKVSVTWDNVNMTDLALKVVACARIGFDPALPNHINMVPYKNNTTGKYDIGFVEGYRGKELKAMKYGFDVPTDVIVEVVYSTDVFKPIKKDKNNPVETYIFEVKEPFNRGEIVGGFWYHRFEEHEEKNRLMFYSVAEIEKRKPDYASSEFWGGKKDKWETDENGKRKKVGTEEVEGWYHEMCYKTIYRAAFNAITIDGKKIDDDYIKLVDQAEQLKALFPDEAINANANKTTIVIEDAQVFTPASAAIQAPPASSNETVQQPAGASGTQPAAPQAPAGGQSELKMEF